eukprot:m.38889 g.38889  ORF g.38889 m.38889 type:complete len:970 (+) comp9489_c0_seq2:303-3212(+)
MYEMASLRREAFPPPARTPPSGFHPAQQQQYPVLQGQHSLAVAATIASCVERYQVPSYQYVHPHMDSSSQLMEPVSKRRRLLPGINNNNCNNHGNMNNNMNINNNMVMYHAPLAGRETVAAYQLPANIQAIVSNPMGNSGFIPLNNPTTTAIYTDSSRSVNFGAENDNIESGMSLADNVDNSQPENTNNDNNVDRHNSDNISAGVDDGLVEEAFAASKPTKSQQEHEIFLAEAEEDAHEISLALLSSVASKRLSLNNDVSSQEMNGNPETESLAVVSHATSPAMQAVHCILPDLLSMWAKDPEVSDAECFRIFVSIIKTCKAFRQSMKFYDCWGYMRQRINTVFFKFPPTFNKMELGRLVNRITGKQYSLRENGRKELRRVLCKALWTTQPSVTCSSTFKGHNVPELVSVIGKFVTHVSSSEEKEEFRKIRVRSIVSNTNSHNVFLTDAKNAFKLEDSDFTGLDKTVKIHRTYHNMIYMFDREDIIERAVQKYKNVKYMSTLQLEYPGLQSLLDTINDEVFASLRDKIIEYSNNQIDLDKKEKWVQCDKCDAWRIITGRRVMQLRKEFTCSRIKKECNGVDDVSMEALFTDDQPNLDNIPPDHPVIQNSLEGNETAVPLSVAKRYWAHQCSSVVNKFKQSCADFAMTRVSKELWRIQEDEYIKSCNLDQELYLKSSQCEEFQATDNVKPRHRLSVLCKMYFESAVEQKIKELRQNFENQAENEWKEFKNVIGTVMRLKLKVQRCRVEINPGGRNTVAVDLEGTTRDEYNSDFVKLIKNYSGKEPYQRLNLKERLAALQLQDVLVDNKLVCSGSLITSKRLEAKYEINSLIKKAEKHAAERITEIDFDTVSRQNGFPGWDKLAYALNNGGFGQYHPTVGEFTQEEFFLRNCIRGMLPVEVVEEVRLILTNKDLKLFASEAQEHAKMIVGIEGSSNRKNERFERLKRLISSRTSNNSPWHSLLDSPEFEMG